MNSSLAKISKHLLHKKNSKHKVGHRGIIKNRVLFLMTIPGIIYFLIVNYIPMFYIVIAFQDFNPRQGILKSSFVGFKNFEFFFKSSDAVRVISNTLLLNIMFILTTLIFSVAMAIILNEIKNTLYNKVVQTMMFLPYFLSYVIVGFFVLAFLNPNYGLINNILVDYNIEPVMWYSEAKHWPFILTAINLWKSLGVNTIIYMAAILNIPKEMYEAAEIDGAKRIQKIFSITIPSIMPIISIMTLLSIGNIMRGNFDLIYNVTSNAGSLYSTTDVIDTYVIRALRQIGDLGMASSVGLFQSVVGFVLVFSTNAIVKRRNHENALF